MFRCVVILILIAVASTVHAQTAATTPKPPATLGLESGFASFGTADFSIKLVNASQTLAALEPRSAAGFDFTPADRLNDRASDGFYQFGDINFRIRDREWRVAILFDGFDIANR